MDSKTEKDLKDKKVGIFCDDSNLYHSYKKYGWRLDVEIKQAPGFILG